MKKHKILLIVLLVIALSVITILVYSIVKNYNEKHDSNISEFKDYISAISPSVISKNDAIILQFTDSFSKAINKDFNNSVFSITPNVKGSLDFNNNILSFKPDKALESDKKYTVTINLKTLCDSIPKEKKHFIFSFRTKKQNINLSFSHIKTTDRTNFTTQDIYYNFELNDNENIENIEKCFSNSENLPMEITAINDKEFSLIVKNFKRNDTKNKLFSLKYDGKKIDAQSKGVLEIDIPPTNLFKVLDVQVKQSPEQYINVVFSDPIKEEQYLDGLITLTGIDNLKFLILDNCIKIIPEHTQTSTRVISISETIKNINNIELGSNFSQEISFATQKPELRKDMQGNILTSNKNKQIISFQAANIKAVDLQITRIYENNILQFLQTNTLNGDSYLYRVGNVVAQKTIDLSETNVNDFNKFNTFFIDISDIIKVEPGAIYRIEIAFRKENSIYINEDGIEVNNPVSFLPEDNNWNWFGNYSYLSYENNSDYYYNYDSSNENSPASDSYYGYKKAISFNILASNIGLIVKQGEDKNLTAYVTDILNAKTINRAKVSVYNYQQQLLAESTTSNDGKVEFTLKKDEVPHFVVATSGKQKAYITLEDYLALYTSKFDVSGEIVQNGTSAFIYTERGVWRPGDSIFMGFILNEKLNKAPIGTPIKLEVRNPQNQLIYTEIQEKNEKGFHVFKFNTEINAITGYYNAIFKFGGQSFSKSLMVETIKPNRLNISLDFDKKYLTGDGSVNASLLATWLHGNPAANMNFTTDVSFSLLNNPFTGYEEYSFNNVAAIFNDETNVIIKGKTDNNGEYKAPVVYNKMKNAPGVLNANLITKVIENGGNINLSERSITYYPYKYFIGIKGNELYNYPINKEVKFNFIALDINKQIITQNSNVEISVYKIESYYWYDVDDQKIDYITANYNNAISRKKYSFTGKGEYNVVFPEAGSYFVVVKNIDNGQIASKQIYASQYYDENTTNNSLSDSPEILKFQCDKEKYNVGEEIKINIPIGCGVALISIENSTKILKSFWKSTNNKNEIAFTIDATSEMAPNVFVNITFIQAHNNARNDAPIRVYGIIPVFVEDPSTHLNPKLEIADELEAETEINLTVSEENGKKMTYTIAMVDEGLLALTNFKTPNPWNTFFSKKALGVKTWDIYDNVIKAFAIDAGRTLTIGGDMSDRLSDSDIIQANRFKPMVRFIGPFTLKKGEKQKHKIKLPQYIGAVRTMVVAANENAFGSTEKTSKVIKPLMVLGTAPRKIGINETFKVPVTVFAMKENINNINISINTNDKLKIIGAKNKNVSFNKTGEKYIEFDIKAGTEPGIGKINITATCNNITSNYDIELDVKYLNNKITETINAVKDPAEKYEKTFDAIGIEGTNEAYLEIYSIPAINLEKRLDYLITYPHGCIEQTVSAAFPQLYLESFITLDTTKKKEVENNIKTCISKLGKYQCNDGGFAYWQGNKYADEWATSYAGHFMIEAEKLGYAIPINVKNNWLKYQKKNASTWSDKGQYSQEIQAYRLLTLALSGNADMSAMNRLKAGTNTTMAKWNLANAYSQIGKESIAKEIILNLNKNITEYYNFTSTFGSATRDKAIILSTLTNLNDKNNAFLMLKEIAEILGSDKYCSTQTTAYSLMEIAKYIKKYGNSTKINCKYTLNGKEYSAVTEKSVFRTKLPIKENENKLSITSNSDDILYISLVLKGIPEADKETTANSFINMRINYTNLEGNPIDISNLPQGSDFIATITIQHNNPSFATLKNVALTQIFPSGWEILNSRMYTAKLGETSYYTYQDIRDDRILTYLDMYQNKEYTYKVMLTASYCGTYYLPATICETMYDNDNYARIKGKYVKVTSN